MSFLAPTGSQWRAPEIGKSVIVSTYRGVLRIQAWPRKRGLPTDAHGKYRLDVFRMIQGLIKRLHPRESIHEREAIARHNRTHRGQRGSAAIRLRDWQTQRLMGRGILIQMPGLGTIYPPAIRRDASFILDHATDIPGEVLQRTGQQWEEIAPGSPGQILTAQAPGSANAWADPI